jgi:two-component system, NtrC family, nitrogen regulation sensor histidine kinase NtrY
LPDSQQNSASPILTRRGRRRLTKVIILSILVLLLMLSIIAQGGFNLRPFIEPDTAGETLLFYALSTLNFLAFITVLFVLLRNVIKLVRELRAGRLGSKFKARLVSYAIGLSLLPVLLLFFFAFGLLNRSIDRWFSDPTSRIVDDAKEIQDSYFKKEESELVNIARAVSRALSLSSRVDYSKPDIEVALKQEMLSYNLALARFIAPGQRVTVQLGEREVQPEIEETLGSAEQHLQVDAEPFTGQDDGESPMVIYVIAGVKLSETPADQRLLIVAREFPPQLTQQAANIKEQHNKFHLLRNTIKGIKSSYVLLLGAVTLLLVFSGSWLALYVARGISVPIQALAEATERVAHGDFSQPVTTEAEDELAMLVSSFNQMAAQLGENRERLEKAAEELHTINLALDSRRRYIETVMESLSTGVISVDESTGVTTINRAALFMLGLERRPDNGTLITQLIEGPVGSELAALCRRSRRSETAQAEVEFKRPDGSSLHTATTAISLRSGAGNVEGWVLVIEDLTDLIQAERAAAWSEVARRMAHEIKNPLTPIQLSAERIMRNYAKTDDARSDSRFDSIVREGTSTIVSEVAALQRIVEEFSRFARLPEARTASCSLNQIVRDAINLYADRLNGIKIQSNLDNSVPELQLDREQIKQVLVNLIENAVEALVFDGQNGKGPNGSANSDEKLIKLETRLIKSSEVVRLIVSDTGHGIRPSDRDKLFLPKFSTRDRGTGLGLAIVSHIIADHKGRVWVEDNHPRGARFIVELPVGNGDA